MDLTLTPAARSAIARQAARSAVPHRAGLRISAHDATPTRLMVRMADAPEPGDVAVEHGGARIFCTPAAGRRMDGGRLDVRRDERGRLAFVVRHAGGRLP